MIVFVFAFCLQPYLLFPKARPTEALISVRRSLSSKVVSQYSTLLSPMAVDSVLKVLNPERPEL